MRGQPASRLRVRRTDRNMSASGFWYNLLTALLCAPLAQLDRASGYEPEGREFESLRARHTFLLPKFPTLGRLLVAYCKAPLGDRISAGAISRADFHRGEGVALHFVLPIAFYVDPGSGSMILQLLLGGVSGSLCHLPSVQAEDSKNAGHPDRNRSLSTASPLTEPVPPENEDPHRRSA